MKAVILAAGKSTRTYPLTAGTPKPLIRIAGKAIIERTLEALEGLVDEAIIVVGFGKEMIQQALGSGFRGIRITYAEQAEQLGTGHALQAAEPFLGQEPFLVLGGDDIYSREDLERLAGEVPSVLAQEMEDPSAFGTWIEKDGFVAGFEEKPQSPRSNLVNTAAYSLGPEVFLHTRKLRKTRRGEYELNEAVFAMSGDKPVRIVKTRNWQPVGYPWHVLDANRIILDSMDHRIEGEVEEGVTIKGKVTVGRGSLVKAGTYIEGPAYIGRNSVVGPNAYIRPYSSIGDNCRVGNCSEIKNSVLGDGSKAPHFNYLADSLVGKDVGMAGYSFTCNLRHDRGIISTHVKGELTKTGRSKFGAVIGDGATLGANTIIYPGRKIWPGKTTLPGEIVKKDLE